MASTITHTQVRSLVGDQFQVVDTVTATVIIAPEVFVYQTVGPLVFDHVATVLDMLSFPTSQAAAVLASLPFYRLATVTKIFPAVDQAQDFATTLIQRMTALASEYDVVTTAFVGTTTETLP